MPSAAGTWAAVAPPVTIVWPNQEARVTMLKELYPVTVGSQSGLHVMDVTVRIYRPPAPGDGVHHNTVTFGIKEAMAAGLGTIYHPDDANPDHAVPSAGVSDTYGSGYADTHFYIDLGTGVPTSLDLHCVLREDFWRLQNGTWESTKDDAGDIVELYNYACLDASIDTRRGYGKANDDGSTTPESNWDWQNVNFGTYTYHGGLFLGFQPVYDYSTGRIDHSGLARIQFWPQSAAYDQGRTIFVTLTLLDMGAPMEIKGNNGGQGGNTPSAPYADIPIASAYIRQPNDPNHDKTYSDTVWANRWIVKTGDDPGGQYGTPSAEPNAPTDQDFGDPGLGGVYINWPVTTVDTSSNPTGAIYQTKDFTNGIILALTTEPGDTDYSDFLWRYFASADFAAVSSNKSFPYNCSAPRTWELWDGETSW